MQYCEDCESIVPADFQDAEDQLEHAKCRMFPKSGRISVARIFANNCEYCHLIRERGEDPTTCQFYNLKPLTCDACKKPLDPADAHVMGNGARVHKSCMKEANERKE